MRPLVIGRLGPSCGGAFRGAARFGDLLAVTWQRMVRPASTAIRERKEPTIAMGIKVWTGRLPPNAPHAPQFPRPFWCGCAGGVFHWPSSPLMKGVYGNADNAGRGAAYY